MHQGCISLGDVQCDGCHRTIPYSECYLAIEETQGVISRLCVDCCLDKGYADYRQGKDERVLTFFPEKLARNRL